MHYPITTHITTLNLQNIFIKVENALEVEFNMLPGFLRKKYCIRKEKREMNKYRSSNFIKRFFFEDSNLSLENITKAVDEDVVRSYKRYLVL